MLLTENQINEITEILNSIEDLILDEATANTVMSYADRIKLKKNRMKVTPEEKKRNLKAKKFYRTHKSQIKKLRTKKVQHTPTSVQKKRNLITSKLKKN
jgi:hypothetical protein